MRKVSHFTREPLKVIKKYSDEELDRKYEVEDDFQREAIRFIYCLVDPIELIEIASIPGGSARLLLHLAAKLKLNGVRAGVSDLLLLWRNRGVAFIELKASKGSTSPAQDEFSEYLTLTNHRGCVCKTLREIKQFLSTLQMKLR